ncbi:MULTISPECIES: hypothetical protein [unclassified Dysgonomonas]|jgi:hypothetical protein|uniref:hypothetical protein n=1 Tax=unclassified Dysgonomonas TaxID=2630389 RepID=UPI0025B84011|nr:MULTISPECIES: hypothetical protein [unclassified Dysgonomonas]MDR2002537.1 hypothetical protein [Prevotella sp.]HMM04833.1 hypothetical protein [Dysgonomonas sp.]
MKTDLYTKIVLTVIAIALVGNLLKDVDFVTKAQAKPVDLDLSALKIEKAESDDDKEMTFFIYENSKIRRSFSVDNYERCEIGYKDVPIYIITSKKVPRFRQTHMSISRTE